MRRGGVSWLIDPVSIWTYAISRSTQSAIVVDLDGGID